MRPGRRRHERRAQTVVARGPVSWHPARRTGGSSCPSPRARAESAGQPCGLTTSTTPCRQGYARLPSACGTCSLPACCVQLSFGTGLVTVPAGIVDQLGWSEATTAGSCSTRSPVPAGGPVQAVPAFGMDQERPVSLWGCHSPVLIFVQWWHRYELVKMPSQCCPPIGRITSHPTPDSSLSV